jgi:hypothetical protein
VEKPPVSSAAPPSLAVPAEQAAEVAALARRRDEGLAELARRTTRPRGYVGKFEQPGPTLRKHRGDPMLPREAVAPGGLTFVGPRLSLAADAPEAEKGVVLDAKKVINTGTQIKP